MSEIESVVVKGTVRVRRGVNADQVTVLDPYRKGFETMRFEECDDGGVRVFIDGELTTKVGPSSIHQIMYAPAVTKVDSPQAKAAAK